MTVKVFPPAVTVPVRDVEPVCAAMLTVIVPLPDPLPLPVIVSQLLLLLAFQLQAAAVVIVSATLPPDDPMDLLVGDRP